MVCNPLAISTDLPNGYGNCYSHRVHLTTDGKSHNQEIDGGTSEGLILINELMGLTPNFAYTYSEKALDAGADISHVITYQRSFNITHQEVDHVLILSKVIEGDCKTGLANLVANLC